MKKTLFLFALLFTFPLKASSQKTYQLELTTQHAKIPFVIKVNPREKTYELLNGEETIKLVNLGSKKRNHLLLQIPPYEVQLSLDLLPIGPTGSFIKANGKTLPISTVKSTPLPFKESNLSPASLAGRWEVTDNKNEKNILLLEQEGTSLKGSYLTKYGDYRSFHGTIHGQEFSAVSFDGVYNYLIQGKLEKETLQAQILADYKIELVGKRNQEASLPDAYQLTSLTAPLTFSFPDLNSQTVSLKDPEFKNRPVIIQIFGSWCPNCIDELKYLIPWYQEHKKRGIRIVALSFERTHDLKRAQMLLRKIAKNYQLNYPLLIAGVSAEDKPEGKIPGLKNFIAFPTTIFLDRNHHVYKVHAGFTGPSTKEFYEQWKKEFNQTVNELLK